MAPTILATVVNDKRKTEILLFTQVNRHRWGVSVREVCTERSQGSGDTAGSCHLPLPSSPPWTVCLMRRPEKEVPERGLQSFSASFGLWKPHHCSSVWRRAWVRWVGTAHTLAGLSLSRSAGTLKQTFGEGLLVQKAFTGSAKSWREIRTGMQTPNVPVINFMNYAGLQSLPAANSLCHGWM